MRAGFMTCPKQRKRTRETNTVVVAAGWSWARTQHTVAYSIHLTATLLTMGPLRGPVPLALTLRQHLTATLLTKRRHQLNTVRPRNKQRGATGMCIQNLVHCWYLTCIQQTPEYVSWRPTRKGARMRPALCTLVYMDPTGPVGRPARAHGEALPCQHPRRVGRAAVPIPRPEPPRA